MSNPTPTLVSLNLRLSFPAGLSEVEQLKERALFTIRLLAGFGLFAWNLTSDDLNQDLSRESPEHLRAQAIARDVGLNAYGQVVAALADDAYSALEEFSEAVSPPSEPNSKN